MEYFWSLLDLELGIYRSYMIFIVDLVEYPILGSWVVNKLPNESDLPSTFKYDCPALRYYFVNNLVPNILNFGF